MFKEYAPPLPVTPADVLTQILLQHEVNQGMPKSFRLFYISYLRYIQILQCAALREALLADNATKVPAPRDQFFKLRSSPGQHTFMFLASL